MSTPAARSRKGGSQWTASLRRCQDRRECGEGRKELAQPGHGPTRRGGLANFERIDADRLGDILELRRAEIADLEIEPLLHLAIRVLGKTDRAGLRDAFEPRGDIDAVAHQVAVTLLDNVTQVNADTELDALFWR